MMQQDRKGVCLLTTILLYIMANLQKSEEIMHSKWRLAKIVLSTCKMMRMALTAPNSRTSPYIPETT